MGRMVSRSRPREGKGLGAILSESVVYVVAAVGIIIAVRWYFFIFLKSPTNALQKYLGASKGGDVKTAYSLLSADTKSAVGDQDAYDDKFPFAHGLQGHMIDYKIEKITETDDTAEADVTQTVRKAGLEVYQSASDNFADHYVLRKESGGWKIDLRNSKLKSLNAAKKY